MSDIAVLLMDLQRDFVGGEDARMPVDPAGAAAVLRCAQAILVEGTLGEAMPVLVVNRFARTSRVANFFRRGAAVVGSPGAEIDPRVPRADGTAIFAKCRASAFTNPSLQGHLAGHGIRRLLVMGVFAEGCVRATVQDALRRGYEVSVIADAVASDRPWKKRFALWAMRRAGARILPSLADAPR